MAQFKIDQTDSKLTVLPTGEPTRATVYERRGDQFHDTKEPKSIDGVPVWNVPAVLLQEGTTRPLANKIIVVAQSAPVVQLMAPAQAEELTIDTNGRFHATGLKAAGGGFPMPKTGDAR